jgi:hypothetical protein
MHVGDAHTVNLCKKLPDVLICGLRIITSELSKIQYLKTSWIWNHVKILGVRLLVRSSPALRSEPKLP